jgi:hypothetical protein
MRALKVVRLWDSPQDTFTSTGGLIRLIARNGEFVGAIVVHCPWPWVWRRPYLCAEDLD